MFLSVLRSLAAVVAGLFLAFVLVIIGEIVGAVLHPFPEGADQTDMETVKAHVAKFPHWGLALFVAIWGGTALAGTWLATRLGTGRHPAHGIVVGVLLLAAAGLNMWFLPYQLWFEIAIVIVFPLATFLGVRLARAAS